MKRLKLFILFFLLSFLSFGQVWINYSGASWEGGLQWTYSANTFLRLGKLADETLGASPGNAKLPIHSQMKGCLLLDNGEVNYFLDPLDWSKKADGSASDLTGGDGQVMVRIPKFYQKYDYTINGNDTIYQWWISNVYLKGYSIHPAFVKDGAAVSCRYIGAYEAVLYDVSKSKYVNNVFLDFDTLVFAAADSTITIGGAGCPTHGFTNFEVGDEITVENTDANNTNFVVKTTGNLHIHTTTPPVNETCLVATIYNTRNYTGTSGDKLSSVSGKMAVTHFNRAQGRTLAKNRGTGWRQYDFDLMNAIQKLVLIEYATFNIQNVAEVGPGISAISYADWDNYNYDNPFCPSGNGNSLGNRSGDNAGSSSIATEKSVYSKYRGIEHLWGHIVPWIEGANLFGNHVYLSNNSSVWADDTSTGYDDLGHISSVDGWQRMPVNSIRMMLPDTCYWPAFILDYFHVGYVAEQVEWNVPFSGGTAEDNTQNGPWSWWGEYNSTSREKWLGTRLTY
jgi:hypothetical protein